jgi:hypothetical protein
MNCRYDEIVQKPSKINRQQIVDMALECGGKGRSPRAARRRFLKRDMSR